MRKFVIGDIHGAYSALIQVLERCGFVEGEDLLISLGDLTDRKPQSKEVLDFLGKLHSKGSFVGVRGNHDDWAITGLRWMAGWLDVNKMTVHEKADLDYWLQYGGRQMINSYGGDIYTTNLCDMPNVVENLALLNGLKPYLVIDNMLFVHGGFDWDIPIEKQPIHLLNWDRELFEQAKLRDPEVLNFLENMQYDKVFVGHTSTTHYKHIDDYGVESRIDKPIIIPDISKKCLINMDTGVANGKGLGRLSVMNIHSNEIFQSDRMMDIYV